MTLSISIEGIGVLTDAESIDNWGVSGAGGVSISLNTETFIQGSNSVASKIASGKYGWIYYDYGTAVGPLDFTGSEAGQYVYIWMNTTTVGFIDSFANGGFAVQLGTDSTHWRRWIITCSDLRGNKYSGGWVCAVIDPTSAGSQSSNYDPANVRYFGIYYYGSGSSVAQNVFCDTIAVGKGLRITGTDVNGWKDVADYCNESPTTRVWGMLQQKQGIYFPYGTIFIGDSGQSAVTTMIDSGRVFRFGDFEYATSASTYVSSLSSGFNSIIVEDASGHATTWEETGSTFIGSENANTTFNVYGGSEATSLTIFNGVNFQRITGGFTWGDDSDHSATNCTWDNCYQVDLVGAPVISNCTFKNYAGSDGALLWNESIDIGSCQFISNDIGIEMPSDVGTPYGYNALTFTDNTYDVNNTSGNPIEINKNLGSNPNSYTGSTVTFLGVSVDCEITVLDITNDSPIDGAFVLAWVTNNDNYFYQATPTSITGSGTTATVTQNGHGLQNGDYVIVQGVTNDDEYNGVFEITKINDNSYSYTTNESITNSPASGTIKITMAVIALETSSGIVIDTRSWNNNQAIAGRIRSGSSAIKYQQGVLSGTIDNENGLDLTVRLVRDQ